MSDTDTSILVNGSSTQRIRPELCEVSFRVAADSLDSNEALEKVTKATNGITGLLKDLAPHKAEATSAALALDDEPPMVDGFPVTKWSMQRVNKHSRTGRVQDARTDREQAAQGMMAATTTTTTTWREETRYYVNTSLQATFHDFDKLEEFVAVLMRESTVQIDNLNWSVTAKTEANYTAAVRANAVRSALAKARDYAAPLAALSDNATPRLRVVEVADHSNDGHPRMYAAKAMPMMARMQESANDEPINFEPEPVEVNANVSVKIVVQGLKDIV